MFERKNAGRHFVFTDDKDVARSNLIGGLKRLFQLFEKLVSQFDYQIVPSQFASDTRRFAIHPGAEWSHINVGLAEYRLRRRSQRKHQTVFSNGKPDARSRRSANASERPSYLPPPRIAFCAPSEPWVNSNAVKP